nr:MAG TPA: hypothetical protein [Caudoviricetes sp.]
MAETMKLTVDTGAITIELVDEKGREIGTFDFNPSDSNIIRRYKEVVEHFGEISQSIRDAGGLGEEEVGRISDEIAQQIDYLLGYNVSEQVFCRLGALTITGNGDLYFERVLDGIADVIEKITSQRVEKKLARVRKATEKYSK